MDQAPLVLSRRNVGLRPLEFEMLDVLFAVAQDPKKMAPYLSRLLRKGNFLSELSRRTKDGLIYRRTCGGIV